ncbi:uncharacterized protein [Musca autumnalis]|uniref:uncharacterized protein n=1 Tax=Musca autumnalis TaxID=221902 RepID=UPI003CE89A90
MKFFTCFAILACIIACVLACDPDSNNEPTCTSSNLNMPIRNFWDPTCYWQCTKAGAAAEIVRCPTAELFDSDLGKCVSYKNWVWTFPCPQN